VIRALPLMAAAGLTAYGVLMSAGLGGLALLAVILLLIAALAACARRPGVSATAALGRMGATAILAAPAVMIVFFSFSSGGFFPGSVAIGALAVAVLLVARLGLAAKPLDSFGAGALVPLVGLAGLAGWALLSQLWSHAPGRAMISFDRDLLYLLTFALFASLGRTRVGVSRALRGVVLAMTAVAAVALLSRVAPNILATSPMAEATGRLAYPLTYWNSLGAFCAIALVLCLHLSADDDRLGVRVFAAGALPVLGTVLLLTYSRGALAVAIVGLVVYAVLGRPRGLLSALLAGAPTSAVAIRVAYGDTLLSSATPTSGAALHQGHRLAIVVVVCVAVAIVLRAFLLLLDGRLEGEDSPIEGHWRALRNSALGIVAVAVILAIVLGAPGAIANSWRQFVDQPVLTQGTLVRSRLSNASSNGRIELWTIAWDAFLAHPIDGTGAETYEVYYYEHRTNTSVVVNAHSLYMETLGDLGLVGCSFLLLYVLGTLVGVAPFRRGRDRALYAALFAAGLTWALHAGVDWDWQMPAVSLPFAALGGLALARPAWRGGAPTKRASARILCLGAIVAAAGAAPALVLASQISLTEATSAYGAGNCASAEQYARRSIDALDMRAPAWQIEALCSVRAGRYGRAEAELRSGLAEDPNDWQLESALAASVAATGADARPEAADALRLDPVDPNVQALARALSRGPSRHARSAAIAFLSQQSLIESG
jgi:hypothetical protein